MANLGFGGDSPYSATNPYLDKSVNDAQAATTRAFNNTTQPSFTSAMVHSGSFGNSGLQQAQGDATRQYQDTLGKQANDMYSGNYQFGQSQSQAQNQFGRQLDQNNSQFGRNLDQQQNQYGRTLDQQHNQFGRSLDQAQNQYGRSLDQNMNQFSQQLGQNQSQFNNNFDRGTYNDAFNHGQTNYGNAMSLLGMQNQSNQQNLGFGTQVQNAPMNYYQGFANTANGIGNGFGTQVGTSSAPGSGMMGALGGAQIGAGLQKQYGDQIGSWFGSGPSGGYGMTGNDDVTSLGSYGLGGGR